MAFRGKLSKTACGCGFPSAHKLMKLLLLPVAVVVLVRYATVLVLALVIVLYLLFWPLINSLRHRRQPEKCRKGSTFVACCTCSNESCPNSARLGSSLIEQLVKWPLTVNVLSIGFPTNVFPSLHKSIIFSSATFTWQNNLSALVHLMIHM